MRHHPVRVMTLADKLQLKAGRRIAVLNSPEGLDLALAQGDDADALLLFIRDRADFESRSAPLIEAAERDDLAWIAYPKAGRLETDLNRDALRDLLVERGVRPVRQIAIDDVWSALRVRPG